MRPQFLSALALIALLVGGCAPLPGVPGTQTAPTAATTEAAATAAPEPTEAPTAAIAESPLPAPTEAPTPAGPVSATGVIYTTANGGKSPLANIGVRLARVIWNEDKSDGAFVLEGGTSPSAITDASGTFAFHGVAAGDYVVVVGDPYGSHEIISKPDGKAVIYTVVAESPTDWGEIVVSLAP